jgi:hypothetical protein
MHVSICPRRRWSPLVQVPSEINLSQNSTYEKRFKKWLSQRLVALQLMLSPIYDCSSMDQSLLSSAKSPALRELNTLVLEPTTFIQNLNPHYCVRVQWCKILQNVHPIHLKPAVADIDRQRWRSANHGQRSTKCGTPWSHFFQISGPLKHEVSRILAWWVGWAHMVMMWIIIIKLTNAPIPMATTNGTQ